MRRSPSNSSRRRSCSTRSNFTIEGRTFESNLFNSDYWLAFVKRKKAWVFGALSLHQLTPLSSSLGFELAEIEMQWKFPCFWKWNFLRVLFQFSLFNPAISCRKMVGQASWLGRSEEALLSAPSRPPFLFFPQRVKKLIWSKLNPFSRALYFFFFVSRVILVLWSNSSLNPSVCS